MGVGGDGGATPKTGSYSETAWPPLGPRDARDYFKEVEAAAPSTSQAAARSWAADEWSEVNTGMGARPLALTKPAPSLPVTNPFEVLDDAEPAEKSE
jgi:hypothetical protein